ncbi:MAG: hypothetical protein FWE71_10210 [Nocardioidaceae bacterium]|nr:hypothetical protein [Nocardioidaceae bacterium]MCL2613647.1 hypothetical protein [Nocardioidaceae bacterium]
MSHSLVVVLGVLVMVALIVGVDVAFLRNNLWLRLVVNIVIVALFALAYWWYHSS